MFALLGWFLIIGVLVLATISSVFLLFFGGEEFSPIKDRSFSYWLVGETLLVTLWIMVFTNAPFSVTSQ